jgi:hypothetical protein
MVHSMTGTNTHRVSTVIDRSRFPTLRSFVEWGTPCRGRAAGTRRFCSPGWERRTTL